MAGELLRAELCLERGDFRLEATLQVPPGVTVVFGPSGCGKSSLLLALAGLLRPRRGQVALGDQLWSDSATGRFVPAHRRSLAFVFQGPSLFPHLSVLQNVEFAVDRSLPRTERLARARASLERMRVGSLAGRRPGSLSGGESQRVALARAFAREPRLVLLDEPFSALDSALRVELASEVAEQARVLGVPLLHVTHDRAEARTLAERVLRVEAGRVEGGGLELLERELRAES